MGLSLEEILALGAAKGKFRILSNFLAIVCLGNLTAIVVFFAFAISTIFEFNFFFQDKCDWTWTKNFVKF